jgi:hypothetical protein
MSYDPIKCPLTRGGEADAYEFHTRRDGPASDYPPSCSTTTYHNLNTNQVRVPLATSTCPHVLNDPAKGLHTG